MKLLPLIKILSISAFIFITKYSSADQDIGPFSNSISFGVLRIIYPELEKKGVVLQAKNNSNNDFLFQTVVRPVDPKTGDAIMEYNSENKMPLIITPPLTRLESLQTLDLRIRRNEINLPSDRESVFFVSMKAIPSQDYAHKNGQLVMTVVTNMKVFFRPEALNGIKIPDISKKIKFTRDNQGIIADNPSAYWITFSMLKVGNYQLDKSSLRMMIPPFSKQKYSVPKSIGGNISWQLIDEDGWNTSTQTQIMN